LWPQAWPRELETARPRGQLPAAGAKARRDLESLLRMKPKPPKTFEERLPPQAYENDFLPGWDVSKKSSPPGFLEENDRWIEEKKKIVAQARQTK
jgi:hypothetical protein